MPLARDVDVQRAGRRARRHACGRSSYACTDVRHRFQTEQDARPVRAHAGLGLRSVRRTGQSAPGGAVPGGLAPGPRAGNRPGRPGRLAARGWIETSRRGPGRARPCRGPGRGPGRTGRTERRAGRGDHSRRPAWERAPRSPGSPSPVHQAAARCAGPAPAQGGGPDGRQDVLGTGRHNVPPFDVRHADLPELWPRAKRWHANRPGQLRLRPGGPGCAALRGAVRPVHPELAPIPRLRSAVLRCRRTAAATGSAHPYRGARHRVPNRVAPGARRHLPPGVVGGHVDRPLPGRRTAGLARGQRQLPRPSDWGSPAHLGRRARRDQRRGRAAARRPVR